MSMQPDMIVTNAAAQRFSEMLHASGHQAIRLSVREAGCSGLEYVMGFADAPQSGDLQVSGDGFVLLVDGPSYEKALKGLRIDFQKDLLSATFVYDNPNKKGECGCGISFSV